MGSTKGFALGVAALAWAGLTGCAAGPGHTRAAGAVTGTALGAAIGSTCGCGGALAGGALGLVAGTIVGDGIAQDQEARAAAVYDAQHPPPPMPPPGGDPNAPAYGPPQGAPPPGTVYYAPAPVVVYPYPTYGYAWGPPRGYYYQRVYGPGCGCR